MTGISIFLIGSVLFTNLGFLAYLLLERGKGTIKDSPPPHSQKKEETISETSEAEQSETCVVGKSKFNIDEFEAQFIRVEDRLKALGEMLDRLEGDVHLKDVEFANAEDRPTDEEIANDESFEKFVPKKFSRMNPEAESNAFEDVRIEDFEPDIVSAPSASGISMEDIENSVDTALNPNAPSEDKAKAGKILNGLIGTDFMDRLTSVDTIYKGVMQCLRESYRMDMGVTNIPKTRKNTSRKSSRRIVPENIDDFNPADLLKK